MSEFFARPWLLLTAPIIYWLLREFLQPIKPSGWANFLPPELAQRLLTKPTNAANQSLLFKEKWVLGLLTLLFSLALAGVGYVLKADQLPSEQQELVVIQYLAPPVRGDATSQRLLDISQQTLIPLFNARQQGKTALIYYAGSAHLVSPMTEDTATLRQLFSLTHPSVMPLGGHAPEAAFRLAASLGQPAISNNPLRNKRRLDWLWLTDTLPNAAAVTQLLNIKPPQARLYLIGLDASLATLEKQQAALASQGITLLHPSQLADYTAQLNGVFAGINQANQQQNQQGIRFFQELSHWPLLAAVLLLLWQYFEQPRFKFNTGLLVLLFGLGLISVQQPLHAANRTDLNAYAQFSLGHYAAAAELFAQWQIENTNAPVKQQAAMHFNTGTAWLLAEDYTLASASFERATALQQAVAGLACNQLLAKWQLANLQLTPQKITKETLLKTCKAATATKSSEPSDDLQDKTPQQEYDWQPQEKPSCVDCEPLSATQEKQLQQLQEDPWRLLKMRFKNELREQQP